MPKGQQIQHSPWLKRQWPFVQPRPVHAHQTPVPSQELSKKQHLKESIWPTWYHTSAFRSYWRQTLEIRCCFNHHNTGWHNWAVAVSFSIMAISIPPWIWNLPMHRPDGPFGIVKCCITTESPQMLTLPTTIQDVCDFYGPKYSKAQDCHVSHGSYVFVRKLPEDRKKSIYSIL